MTRPWRTLRLVYPLRITIMLATAWIVFELACAIVRLLPGDAEDIDAWRFSFGAVLLLAGSFTVGLFRVFGFHPGCHPGYRQLLEQAAWSSARPLPFGPIHLTWADAVFPALTATLLYALVQHAFADFDDNASARLTLLLPPLVFLLGYNLALWFQVSSWRGRYICLGLLPLTFVPFVSIVAALLVQIAVYVVLIVETRSQWRLFPWNEPQWTQPLQQQHLADAKQRGLIGWPWNMLGPQIEFPSISLPQATAWSAMAAWWVLAAMLTLVPLFEVAREARRHSHGATEGAGAEIEAFTVFWGVGCIALAIYRLANYQIQRYQPSPNLWARLVRLRLIVPGYDRVFAAPLLILVYGWFAPSLLAQLGVPWFIIPSLLIFGVLLLAMGVGPSRESWHYTGQHHLWRQACEPVAEKKQVTVKVKFPIGRL